MGDAALSAALGGKELGQRFGSAGSVLPMEQLAQETVGLVTREEFARKRKELAEREEMQRQEAERQAAARKKRQKRQQKATLSFGGDEAGDEGEGDGSEGDEGGPLDAAPQPKRRRGVVAAEGSSGATAAAASRADDAERQQLEAEWERQQAALKAEPLAVRYSVYPDKMESAARTVVTRGSTVLAFLRRVQQEHSLNTPGEDLLFVREDIIVPSSMSFHDLIASGVKGTAGTFCNFEELWRAGGRRKWTAVCERRWYEKHKHQKPADKWEEFDPAKDYTHRGVHGGQQGDWNCPQCSSWNGGSKNPKFCWKCRADRPVYKPLV
eukprot:TRINITY_DN16278_c0_g1_i1.p1 TRINITY_DN16278_c0_g1~~TRINITY_DN16278_c0_g1_i1.p1  ORF type:complete len:368 (+),score=114.47 TRINITY_DN16278_c0_g1_i1:133-1104(+)